jgi:hypothetical protein
MENSETSIQNTNEKNLIYFRDQAPLLVDSLFTDTDFPPDSSSLYSLDVSGKRRKAHFKDDTITSEQSEEQKNDMYSCVVWKRLSDIFPNGYSLFKDKIETNDVKQGVIGNCYLMSSLSSMAQNIQNIKSIFKTQTVSQNGLYEIYYYEGKVKKIIFIDDYIPVTWNQNNFFFAKPNGEEAWVLLLEKAFAKYEGGYTNIIGGRPVDVLKFFTGSHSDFFEIEKLDIWSVLTQVFEKGHVVCAGSKYFEGEMLSPNGIVRNHSYSVIQAKEFKFEEISSLKLVQLRNPQGKYEWKGPYSDGDSNWTPELKQFFNYNETCIEDGRFWMTIDDFVQEFFDLTVCFCGNS